MARDARLARDATAGPRVVAPLGLIDFSYGVPPRVWRRQAKLFAGGPDLVFNRRSGSQKESDRALLISRPVVCLHRDMESVLPLDGLLRELRHGTTRFEKFSRN